MGKKAIVAILEPIAPHEALIVSGIAKKYNAKKYKGLKVECVILPRNNDAYSTLASKIDQLKPDLVLSNGLTDKVERIRLESVGRNIMSVDYTEELMVRRDTEPLIPLEKHVYPTNINNMDVAVTMFDAGIPAEVSNNADSNIANALIYLTSRKIHKEGLPIKYAFFFAPTTIKKTGFEKAIKVALSEMKDMQ